MMVDPLLLFLFHFDPRSASRKAKHDCFRVENLQSSPVRLGLAESEPEPGSWMAG